jgi:hypothetical protein
VPDARNVLADAAARRERSSSRSGRLRCEAALAVLALLFSGCYGDFGRPRATIFNAGRPYGLGAEAAASLGIPPSVYQLTDDESAMRDLAYALIRPPYSRERWFVILGEYRRLSAIPYYGEVYDYAAYAAKLLTGRRARPPRATRSSSTTSATTSSALGSSCHMRPASPTWTASATRASPM